ncbi:hypothetical protein E4T56_gene5917 [Termitomyces sp. T112]|nr:hypothetical protein C0989_005051 [Termitomyces sp. Mn162]KAG5733822.1 hypothetical protein E4T56_gene5917 [Termitomyces sp. T112]KAH0586018.1 hypothetical protein H2248_007295 [Termitomyces sp. 'cryptogamus']
MDTTTHASHWHSLATANVGGLTPAEYLWRDHYDFLKERGYTLRPRYHPEWIPSWLGTDKCFTKCEDGRMNYPGHILDASRADESVVALKWIDISLGTDEITIGKYFSSDPLSTDPRNHCVPILDVIEPKEGSNIAFIVMPLLINTRSYVPFTTIGEVVEFFRQIFEGLHFMHEHNTIHGDSKCDNIMGDGLMLFDSPPHPSERIMKRDFSDRAPRPTTRTLRPIKYYFIDFGLSHNYQGEDPPYLRPAPWGGDWTVPEHQGPNFAPCDPFPVDVYCLGSVINYSYLDGLKNIIVPHKGFEFMRELVTDMVNIDPKKRPTMSEVVSRFDDIIKNLSWLKLRSPVIRVDARWTRQNSIDHWKVQIYNMFCGIPAIPRFQEQVSGKGLKVSGWRKLFACWTKQVLRMFQWKPSTLRV